MNQLPYEYSIGTTPHGKAAIVLHRKPSQVPSGITQDLTYKCGSCIHFLDGPNNKSYYETLGKDSILQSMINYLNRCGWKQV